MKRKKLAVTMAALITIGVILSGCNDNGKPAAETSSEKEVEAVSETKNETEKETEKETEASETGAEISAEGGTISLLSWYNEEQFGPYMEAFEAETGIKIDLQFVPPVQQYVDKFMVLVSSNQMTDMFFTAAENKQEIIERNLAEDLSGMNIFERIPANVSAVYGHEGEIYSYSPDAWVGGIFYNKEIFDQAGISEKPATWDAFVEACEKIKEIGIEPIVSGSEQVHEIPMSLYVSQVIGKDPENDIKINNEEATFADTYTEPFKIWYDEFYSTGTQSQISLGLNSDQALDMFVTGQSAMYSGGPWNIGTFKEKNPDMDFDVFPLADKDGNAVLNGALNVGLSISSSSSNKEAGVKFIEFMSQDENILNWQKTTGNILVVEGVDYEIDSVFNAYKQDAVEGNFYLSQIVWNNSAGIYKELLLGIQDVMTGADTVDNVPVRLDAKMKELNG